MWPDEALFSLSLHDSWAFPVVLSAAGLQHYILAEVELLKGMVLAGREPSYLTGHPFSSILKI